MSLWLVAVLCLLAALSPIPAGGVNPQQPIPSKVKDAARPAAAGGVSWKPPSNADMRALGAASRECLKGKHVRLMGNSVTRHWLFALNDLLRGGGRNLVPTSDFHAMRLEEKKICSLGDSSHTDGYGCTVYHSKNATQIEYIWEHDLFDAGLGKLLSRRPTPDVVIINSGLWDLYNAAHRVVWKPNLLTESDELAKALGNFPNSTYTYWRTTTRLCDQNKTSDHPQAPYFPMINRCLVGVNAHMVDALTRLAPRVHLFDSFGMTMDCRAYMDHVHHPLAAIDHVLIFMSRYCGTAYGRMASATFPHLLSHFHANGDVKPRKCRAQRAAATKENLWDFGDGWNWVNGVLSANSNKEYEVDC